MARAAARPTTKRAPEATDPVLRIAHEIELLWDAHSGAEVEKLAAKADGENAIATNLRNRCDQITEWRDALELVGSYAVASSLPGATVQMAIAMNDLETLAGELEANVKDDAVADLSGWVNRIRRMVRSATDVMITTLGDDYVLYRRSSEHTPTLASLTLTG